LHGPAKEKWRFLQCAGEVRDDGFADLILGGSVEDQAEGALGVVLANQDNRAMEKRAAQLSVVQNQLAFERFLGVVHCNFSSVPETCPQSNLV
jgi:hypothetical protein